jgi:hypothetical protein
MQLEKKEMVIEDIESNKCQKETTKKIKKLNKKIKEVEKEAEEKEVADTIEETDTAL